MSVSAIIDAFIHGDLTRSVEIFAPELILCVTIVCLLLSRLVGGRRVPSSWIALVGTLLAFLFVFGQFLFLRLGGELPTGETAGNPVSTAVIRGVFSLLPLSESGAGTPGAFFTGLMTHDAFALYFRLGLALFLVLVIALTVLSGIPDDDDGPDFYTLLLGATVGMMLTVGANHLLMLFLGVEMMSVPSYAMVAFLKGRRQSSEAALKYVVYGAGAAGVMLYGVSLLSGLLGTANLPELADRFVLLMQDGSFGPQSATSVTLVLGILFVLVGVAFKLSLVPFHFWCPDAFEGASAEVAGFLSVASKAAAFALLVRFVLAFQGEAEVLRELSVFLGLALGVIAAASMTLGNLAAYTQRNIKRLLAYSTIAHAGYMLMAVSAMLVLLGSTGGSDWSGGRVASATARSVEGLMFYIAVYLFMNLAAFSIVALLRNETYSEDIDSFNGLFHANTATKVLCLCMAVAMFSLVGMPPFAGFFAKMMIFYSVFEAGALHWTMWILLAIAGANTVFSLFYYLRVLRAMFIAPRADGAAVPNTPGIAGTYVFIVTAPILLLQVWFADDLARAAREVATTLFQ